VRGEESGSSAGAGRDVKKQDGLDKKQAAKERQIKDL